MDATETVTTVKTVAIPEGLSFEEFSAFIDAAFADAEPTEAELIAEAGKLNNHPALVGTDHVSIMGMMNRAEMVRHVAKLRDLAAA